MAAYHTCSDSVLCAQGSRIITNFARTARPRGNEVFTDLEQKVGLLNNPAGYLLEAGWSESQPSRLVFDLLVSVLGRNIASRWQNHYQEHLLGGEVDGRKVLTHPLTTPRKFFKEADTDRVDPAACMVPKGSDIIWISSAGYASIFLGRHRRQEPVLDENSEYADVEKSWPILLSCSRLACFLKNGNLEGAPCIEDEEGDEHACQIVRHLCFNPACCNPLHVVWGTYQQNRKDQEGYSAEDKRENKADPPVFKWNRERYAELEKLRLLTDRGPDKEKLLPADVKKRGRKNKRVQ